MFLFLLFNTSQYSFTGFTGYTFLSRGVPLLSSQNLPATDWYSVYCQAVAGSCRKSLYTTTASGLTRLVMWDSNPDPPKRSQKRYCLGIGPYFDEFFVKHNTFLPHKRKWGRQIHISHVTFHLKKRRKDLLNL